MKKQHLSWIILLCLGVTLMCTRIVAQDFPYNFQTWNITNGLSSNFCNAICSDRNGYIYVGTNNGLYSFNGRGFNALPYPQAEPLMAEGNVEDLLVDQYNRLWFASLEYGLGLVHLDELNKAVQYFNAALPDSALKAAFRPSKLCFDTKGNLWVGTRGNGLYKFDTSAKIFYPIPLNNSNSHYQGYIRSLTLHQPDSLFVGIVNGLSLLNPLTGALTHIKMQTGKKPIRPTVRSITPFAKDSFVLVTDRGTFWLKLPQGNISPFFDQEEPGNDFSKIDGFDFAMISKDEYWIATENDGVLFYKPSNNKLLYSYQLSMFNKGISKGAVNKFFKDSKNNIWIAHQNGLSLLQSPHMGFYSYSFQDTSVFAGTLISAADKLAFVKSGGIAMFNPETRQTMWRKISTTKNKNEIPSCVSVHNNAYYLFLNDSFFCVNQQTYLSKLLPLKKHRVDSTVFRHFRVTECVVDTINGKEVFLLLAAITSGNTLLSYDPQSGLLDYFTANGILSRLQRNYYTSIRKVGSGKYWISTNNNGLFYTDLANPTNNKNYSSHESSAIKIPGNNISNLLLDRHGDLWMLLFKKGMACLNLKNKQPVGCTLYSKENGLTDDRVYRFIQDDQENFWISSTSGIFCFEKKTGQFLRYNSVNGITNIKFQVNEINLVKGGNGYIAFTDKSNELLWFNPGGVRSQKASLSIKNFTANNEPLGFSLHQPQNLAATQNTIEINYDIIDYEKTGIYNVLYKLDNYEKNWQTTTFTGVQRYKQLPGGSYTFLIKLKYADGSFSEEQRIAFNIATHWYKTWYFKLLVLMAGAALIYVMVVMYMNRKLAKQKAELELQKAILQERTRISAELHDDLGGGLSTIRILSETNQHLNGFQQPGENMHKISSHSKDLLQKMTEIVWALNIKNDTLDQLLSYIRHQTVQTLDETGIQFNVIMPEKIPHLMINGINRRHLLLLVKEVIHNIIKHSGASFAQLQFSMVSGMLEITVHDNGRGINDLPSVQQKGNGMHNMQQHAKALEGFLRLETNGGTTVLFTTELSKISYESVIPHAKHDV